MANEKEELERLAGLLAERARRKGKKAPHLRLVNGEASERVALPSPRDVLLARIKDYARMYWLAWLVRQETAHVGKALEDFNDEELGELMRWMEKGRDCRIEDIPFDDAGLVRGSLSHALGY